jgi:hypothetical protein
MHTTAPDSRALNVGQVYPITAAPSAYAQAVQVL